MMKIALYGKKFSGDFKDNIGMMLKIFLRNEVELYLHEAFSKFLKAQDVNYEGNVRSFKDHSSLPGDIAFLFSVGGDGTFLETVNLIRDSGIPVIGINTGRLGFLANISREEICFSVEELFTGNYTLEDRSLLRLTTRQGDLGELNIALNEITVNKMSMGMISIAAELDGEYLNSYWADGLIISTPTGSTAYSMSVGGPIVLPESETFLISPVAPHNLTVRPIVISNDKKIRLKINSRSSQFMVSLDSRSYTMKTDVELVIDKAPYSLKLVKLKNSSYYHTLRTKLMWGLDKRNWDQIKDSD
jgi:NAD+ kinase